MTDRILLAHGSGGSLSHDIVNDSILSMLGNPILNRLDDSAVFEAKGRIAFTTDSHVVQPMFFPGGDIGRLSVCGTVNDLAVMGATPLYLSLALIIEEGLPKEDLKNVVNSIKEAADEAGVKIVTGDTKVVNRGNADKLFINTAGIGVIADGVNISGHNAKPGNKIILSGTIGDHGIAVLSKREGIGFETKLESDSAPLNKMIAEMMQVSNKINCMRDPTRGGLSSTLNEIAEQSGVSIRIEEEKIPIRREIAAACEMLGLDPLYIANEGKVVAVVEAEDADRILAQMKKNKYGQNAVIIG
ncbi:MAG TPA: hydrogenase expression/formation protein HypE, partial [Dehalococcoidia bacterium]|nr:hydrogenase expression/formation protein HypE [Dehalococcoidia bacterium]